MYFAEKFTPWQAWTDLLLIAQYEPSTFYVRGIKIEVNVGQVAISQEKLALRWSWSRGRVIRFLDELEKDDMIEQQKSSVINIISIKNFSKYQSNDTTDSTTDSTTNDTTDSTTDSTHNKNIKKVRSKELLSFDKESNKETDEISISSPRKKRNQYTAEETKMHSDCRAIFEEKFQQLNNEKYYWTAKDAGALVGVLKQIRFFMPEEKRDDIAELTNNFRIFLDVIIRRADSFTLKKFSLPYINGNFNEIYNAIKDNNGKSANNSSTGGFGYSATELADVLANLQS